MRLIVRLLTILLVNFWLFQANAHALSVASDRGYIFRSLSSKDGLIQNTVNAIHQDAQGFVWIGTQGGLHRYDGFDFLIYQHDPAIADSIPASLISAIAENQSQKTLWVGTDGGGIARIDLSSQRVEQRLNVGNNRVIALIYVNGLGLWVSTTDGIWLVNEQFAEPVKVFASTPTDYAQCFALDQQSQLWVGTSAGKLMRYQANAFTAITTPSMGSVRQISVDSANRLLIAAAQGLFEVAPLRSDVKRLDIAGFDLQGALLSPDGGLWLAAIDRGVSRIDLKERSTQVFDRSKLPGDVVPDSYPTTMMLDQSGQLWIGSKTRGVAITDTNGASFRLLADQAGLDSEAHRLRRNTRAICSQDNSIWYGTELGTLRRVSARGAQDYTALLDSHVTLNYRVNSILCGPRGEVIVATSRGVFSLTPFIATQVNSGEDATATAAPENIVDGYNISTLVPDVNVRSLALAKDGSIWLGLSENGVIQIESTRTRQIAHPLDPNSSVSILSIFEDRDQRLWVGSMSGIFIKEREQNRWQHLKAAESPQSLPGNVVRNIMQQRDGTIWIGTHSGLARVDQINSQTDQTQVLFSRFTTRDGLPNPTVYCLREDRLGRIWLSSNQGLINFLPSRNQWQRFELQDGLQDMEFNGDSCASMEDGQLLFGGVNGVNIFRAETLRAASYIGPVRMLEVRSYKSSISLRSNETLVLPYNQREVQFEFASIDFHAQHRNRYAYQLEGFERNWNEGSGKAIARYTNIPPGEYVFSARASNRDQQWSNTPIKLKLLVENPWWRSPIAYFFYLLAFALLWAIAQYLWRLYKAREQRFIEELKYREDRLRLSLWGSQDMYWDAEISVDPNKSIIHRFGTESALGPGKDGEFPMKSYMENEVHPDDWPQIRASLRDMLIGESDETSIHHRLKRQDGSYTHVLARGRAVNRSKDGRLLRIAGTARSIDKERAAALELEVSSRVIDRMSEAVAVSFDNGNLIRVNAAFEQMTGYQQSDIAGRGFEILQSKRHDETQYQSIQEMVRRDGRWKGEMWQRRKDGADILVSIEFTRIEAGDTGEPLRLAVMSDITDRKRAEDELRFLANYDALTGLPNRTLLLSRMARAMARAKRHNQRVALLFLDLDRFKQINDSMGHATGDELLRGVAERMRMAVRDIDTVSRLAGDEFVLLLEEIDSIPSAEIAAERVISQFTEPFTLNGTDIVVSPSIGLAVFPDHADDADALLKAADLAMYSAKSAGRNTIRMFETEQSQQAIERAENDALLRRALERDQFEVFYQLAVDLRSGKPVGAEALLRWRHPQRGLVAPDAFIPILEENGHIVPVGTWVITEALAQLKAWDHVGLSKLSVAVNLSMLQLTRGDLLNELPKLLHKFDISGDRLTLELTESLVMSNPEQSIETLNKISDFGIQIAIDDFGTGYSSLAYLKRLPIDKIKIDKAFVRDLGSDADDTAITHSIIALSQSLQLTVIAEGVETEQQHLLLRTFGCHQAQGYLYSQAMHAEEITKLLHQKLDVKN